MVGGKYIRKHYSIESAKADIYVSPTLLKVVDNGVERIVSGKFGKNGTEIELTGDTLDDLTFGKKLDCLCFTSEQDGSYVAMGRHWQYQEHVFDIEYSRDGVNWNRYETSDVIYLNKGKFVYFRGNNVTLQTNTYGTNFVMGGRIAASGNVNSLLSADDYENITTLPENCFKSLFHDCQALTTAPKLPATTLGECCYSNMFLGCQALKTAPKLPATILADYCYGDMFSGCYALKSAPKLPATTLAVGCYERMFNGCISLETAPLLPATTLEKYCYESMFWGCTSLKTAPLLPATKLAENCYYGMFDSCKHLVNAPELPATTLAIGCYSFMFEECTSLTIAPELPATKLANQCYYHMFDGCTSLTTAPELPAITLASDCYKYMFYRCNSLNYVKAMFVTPNGGVNSTFLKYVSESGTFVKNEAASWSSGSIIPEGWVVQTATE